MFISRLLSCAIIEWLHFLHKQRYNSKQIGPGQEKYYSKKLLEI